MRKVRIYLRRKERRMRSLMFVLGVALVSCVVFDSSTYGTPPEMGSADWQKFSEDGKLYFVGGILTGCWGIMDEVGIGLYFYDKSKEGLNLKSAEGIYLEQIISNLKRIHDDLSFYDILPTQLVDGVDTFYKDFSNRRIKTIDAIYVVRMQIKGKNPELIDAQIRYLKMQPIDTSAEGYKKAERLLSPIYEGEKISLPGLKEIKEGKVSKDDFLKCGVFIGEDDKTHSLFCYGRYK